MIKVFRVLTTCMLFFWMGMIFHLSNQTATVSSETSGDLIFLILKQFYPDFSFLSASEQASIISSFQFIVRKSAHFSIYAFLGGISFLTVVTYTVFSLRLRTVISAAVCFLYAVSDEVHQYFIPGRSCEFGDVLIDFSGAMLAIMILVLLLFLIKPLKRLFWSENKCEKMI